MIIRHVLRTAAALSLGFLFGQPLEAKDADASRNAKPPELVVRVEPDAAGFLGRKDEVFADLVIFVDADGAVTDVKATGFSHRVYATRAVAAARQWRFRPALRANDPVAASAKFHVTPAGA